MRAPIPVEATSAPGRAWHAALSALVAATVAVPLAWGLPHIAARWGSRHPDPLLEWMARPPVQVGLAAWMALIAFAACWLSRRSAAACERTLRWDGREWVLPGDGHGEPEQRGDAALMLDLGPWMLVRFLPHAGLGLGSTWLPFHLAGDVMRRAALRGALWSWRGRVR